MSDYSAEVVRQAEGTWTRLKADWQAILNGEHGQQGVPFSIRSNVLEASRFVKTGPGVLFGFVAYNSNAAARFILLFDKPSAPVNGDVPEAVFVVAAASHVAVSYIFPGRYHRAGIQLALSTTAATLTLGAAEAFFDAQYI